VLAWLVGVEAVGAISAMLARRGAWFDALQKPAWTAPDWLFESVRTLLFALLALAAWMVWRERERTPVRLALIWFGVLLALAALWAPLLHGLRRPDLAMLCLSALWVTIVMTMISFHRIRAAASWLLLPFAFWTTYVAALVLSLWVRNG
jgi:tryptophan-rich sensory protein